MFRGLLLSLVYEIKETLAVILLESSNSMALSVIFLKSKGKINSNHQSSSKNDWLSFQNYRMFLCGAKPLIMNENQ